MKASVRKAATFRRPAAPGNNDRRVLGPHPRRRFLRLAAGTAVLPAVSRVAWSQAYPRSRRRTPPFEPSDSRRRRQMLIWRSAPCSMDGVAGDQSIRATYLIHCGQRL
jgi:hypothetical protein